MSSPGETLGKDTGAHPDQGTGQGQKQILTLERPGETLAALVVDRQIIEVCAERTGTDQWAGSLFRGRLARHEPALNAWFVDVGLDRQGLVPDTMVTYYCRDRRAKATEGLYLPLQVTGEAHENKGLRLQPVSERTPETGHPESGHHKARHHKAGRTKPGCTLDVRGCVPRLARQAGQPDLQSPPGGETCAPPQTAAAIRARWQDALEPRVYFSAGYLVIEPTTAAVTIDVNVKAGALAGNLAACPVIANEVMARNLAGQIFVDFASMPTKSERTAVLDALQKAFGPDTRKRQFGGLDGASCLVFTRQRLGAPAYEVCMEPAVAPGTGWRLKTKTRIIEALDALYAERSGEKAWAGPQTYELGFSQTCGTEKPDAAFLAEVTRFMRDRAFVTLKISGEIPGKISRNNGPSVSLRKVGKE